MTSFLFLSALSIVHQVPDIIGVLDKTIYVQELLFLDVCWQNFSPRISQDMKIIWEQTVTNSWSRELKLGASVLQRRVI